MIIVPNELLMMAVIGAASGLVGAFALMRRMALASDAISHIALPGLGLAILLKINPLIGGATALVIGTIFIWLIEKRSMLSTDIIIGVIFSASLAIGSILTPAENLLEALFGSVGQLTLFEIIAGALLAAAIIAVIVLNKEKMALAVISPDLARTTGVKVDAVNFVFLFIFALNVILGLKFLGVLLMGSLIIIPAAISKNVSWNLRSDLTIAALTAVLSVTAGFYLAQTLNLAIGPIAITAAAILFFFSLILRKGR